jgi:hypothetical protein
MFALDLAKCRNGPSGIVCIYCFMIQLQKKTLETAHIYISINKIHEKKYAKTKQNKN